jgi:hypothetical protein
LVIFFSKFNQKHKREETPAYTRKGNCSSTHYQCHWGSSTYHGTGSFGSLITLRETPVDMTKKGLLRCSIATTKSPPKPAAPNSKLSESLPLKKIGNPSPSDNGSGTELGADVGSELGTGTGGRTGGRIGDGLGLGEGTGGRTGGRIGDGLGLGKGTGVGLGGSAGAGGSGGS